MLGVIYVPHVGCAQFLCFCAPSISGLGTWKHFWAPLLLAPHICNHVSLLHPEKQALSLISLPLDLGLPILVLEVAELFLDLQVWLPLAHSFSAARGMVSEGWSGHAVFSPSTCLWPFSPQGKPKSSPLAHTLFMSLPTYPSLATPGGGYHAPSSQ